MQTGFSSSSVSSHGKFVASPPAGEPIRVFIAEDHHITLWGLHRLIDASPQSMVVVGTAGTCAEMLAHPCLSKADVVLLDLDLGCEDTDECMTELQGRCGAPILVLTGSDETERHRRAAIHGARGVVHKSEPAENILSAINKIHAGEVCLQPSLLADVLGRLTGARAGSAKLDEPARRIASLTARERQIVETMMQMSGAKQIGVAEALHMSEHTLRNHLTTIYSKLGVHGRLELHVFATDNGMGAKR
jgi:two-component system, NarL family, nitrate/nitrite response regulator NarL